MRFRQQKLHHSCLKIRKVSELQSLHSLISSRLLTIKGAPDILIGRCSKILTINGDVQPLDGSKLKDIENMKNKWSSQGKRVILLARKIISTEQMTSIPANEVEDKVLQFSRDGLTLVGIVGIIDPPRDEIPYVVSTLRRAGIRIFMVRTPMN